MVFRQSVLNGWVYFYSIKRRLYSMQQAFIENIKINKVRHLKDINVPVCKENCKHVIFTGKKW